MFFQITIMCAVIDQNEMKKTCIACFTYKKVSRKFPDNGNTSIYLIK